MRKIRTPKRILMSMLCLVVVLSFFAAPALAVSKNTGRDTLTVGVPADRCPVFYQDSKTGEIVGIGVDLMRTAAGEAGYDVTFTTVGEATLKDALDSEAYDVVMPFGSAINSTSGNPTVVSDNLTQTPFTLVTAGNRELPPLNELNVGMLRSLGGGAETVQQLYPGIQIAMFETMDESVNALRSGKVDALLHNSYVWSYILQKPAYSDLSVQPSAMFSMDFRAGALDTPNGRATIKRLNGGIAKITDTLRQAIVLDYTTRHLYQYDLSDYLHEYGLVLLLGALLIVAVFVIVVLKLRSLRLEQDEKVRWLEDHDSLTGTLSLNGFKKRVESLLRTNPDTPYLITYVNFKNFKFINDSFGRESGDDLLRFFVNKTMEALTDEEAMARIEADHFAVLTRSEGEEGILKGERDVLEPVRNYFINRGEGNRVQICGGIYALALEDYQQVNVDHMLDYARMAERRVRDTHNEGYEIYNPDQWEKGKLAADVVSHLPLAIQTGELKVWYQPQVSFGTGEITGIEALCRWQHAKLGWLRPDQFITTLEESGLIFELDCFVWDKVCQDLSRWNSQGNHLFVSVNLSRSDIQEGRNIPGHFCKLIQTYGLSADQLRIEITESAFAEDPALLINTTMELQRLGFQVEMDDFGSGYSSLHMLKEVPVDRIKLDLHFLTGTGDPKRGRVIVSHMIQMVGDLGMKLIAEGVEDIDQAHFLYDRGCSQMQGFYFYKPMPVQDFEAILSQAAVPPQGL